MCLLKSHEEKSKILKIAECEVWIEKREERMVSQSAIPNPRSALPMRYRLSQDFTCTAPAVWGLVYKFTCICYRSLDRIFDIVYWPVISLLLWGFTSTFVSTTSSFSGVLEFFLGGAVLWSL